MSSIGIFDSGYGGLTIFKSIAQQLPDYNYIYLGDNLRAPYGNRSFEMVYQYTQECVQWLFNQGCELVILACNTASAKALRAIQQNYLPQLKGNKRVLGVIRPTAQVIGNYTKTNNIGILGTSGTVKSGSYNIEIEHFFPEINITQLACPLWVPLVEENAFNTVAAHLLIKNDVRTLLHTNSNIDTILLACTHYPILQNIIEKYIPKNIRILSQGTLVAESLADYLQRHPEIESEIGKGQQKKFYTTGDEEDFKAHTKLFFGMEIQAKQIVL